MSGSCLHLPRPTVGERERETVVEREGKLGRRAGAGPVQQRAPAEGVVRVGSVVDIVLEGTVTDDLGIETAVGARVDVGLDEGSKSWIALMACLRRCR